MIVLGRVIAPFGVRGWLRVHPFGDDPLSWVKIPQWWLSPTADAPPDRWTAYVPEVIKTHADSLVAKLADVDDRDTAESIDGCFIGVAREDLPPVKLGEYYWDDLTGLTVVNLQGQLLGSVKSLLETGAHDVLVVGFAKNERLLPFVEHVIKVVDVSGKVIYVDWEADW
ncbi:ribosome maturation factor RimM [Rugosibacter aromaticivorans]|uniref:Ribosome maturation factor RimM n=1 Tax=Rugosibacter aromaticivorans TaxID=1565605 RepID=A0A0C5J7W1_9PROT|nr:ribosome maturation factor RimM [Rugosibacter aromaticivorans]AJP47828.1 ribosome maturation factor RimM [Rugosibacter aromaticivorans]